MAKRTTRSGRNPKQGAGTGYILAPPGESRRQEESSAQSQAAARQVLEQCGSLEAARQELGSKQDDPVTLLILATGGVEQAIRTLEQAQAAHDRK